MAGTRWVKIDTSYLRNPKITAVSAPAVVLHLASILWTADQLTDGELPAHVLTDLAHMARIPPRSAPRAVNELVDAGLWSLNGNGWHVHDFEAMNGQAMRKAVEAQRRKWREKKEGSR